MPMGRRPAQTGCMKPASHRVASQRDRGHRDLLCTAKYLRSEIFRSAPVIARSRERLRRPHRGGRIDHHLLEHRHVVEIALATPGGDAADRLWPIALEALGDVHQPGRLQHLQVPAQIAVGRMRTAASGRRIADPWDGDQRGQQPQACALMNDAIEAVVGESTAAAGRRLRFTVTLWSNHSTAPTSSCPTPNGTPIAHGDSACGPGPTARHTNPQLRYHIPAMNIGRGRKRHEANTPRLKMTCHSPGNIHTLSSALRSSTTVSSSPATIAGRTVPRPPASSARRDRNAGAAPARSFRR